MASSPRAADGPSMRTTRRPRSSRRATSATPYDLVLLDEQMPGRRGLDVLASLQRDGHSPRVVMVTKSEDDGTLRDAIGRRVEDYVVKPASPRQVLSIVTRLLEGSQLRQERVAQDFAASFGGLTAARERARDWRDFFRLYSDLVDWDLRLREAGEALAGMTRLRDTLMDAGAEPTAEAAATTEPGARAGEGPLVR